MNQHYGFEDLKFVYKAHINTPVHTAPTQNLLLLSDLFMMNINLKKNHLCIRRAHLNIDIL